MSLGFFQCSRIMGETTNVVELRGACGLGACTALIDRIPDVAGAHDGVGDQLTVRVDRDMPFVAVEPAR